MQCGAACLSSICRHYGKPYSTRFISRFCQEYAEILLSYDFQSLDLSYLHLILRLSRLSLFLILNYK